jgi:hypothetical protein
LAIGGWLLAGRLKAKGQGLKAKGCGFLSSLCLCGLVAAIVPIAILTHSYSLTASFKINSLKVQLSCLVKFTRSVFCHPNFL